MRRLILMAAFLLAVGLASGCTTVEYDGLTINRFATDTGWESASATVRDDDGQVVRQIEITGYQSDSAKALELAREAISAARGN